MSLLIWLHLCLAHRPPKLDRTISKLTANQIHTLQTAFTSMHLKGRLLRSPYNV